MGKGSALAQEALDRLIDGLRRHPTTLIFLAYLQGQAAGRHLLRAVEAKALELGCCKITLEVQEKNARARRVYERAGFAQAVYREATGGSLFYAKILEEHAPG